MYINPVVISQSNCKKVIFLHLKLSILKRERCLGLDLLQMFKNYQLFTFVVYSYTEDAKYQQGFGALLCFTQATSVIANTR